MPIVKCISCDFNGEKVLKRLKNETGKPLSTSLIIASSFFLKNKKKLEPDTNSLFDTIDEISKKINKLERQELIDAQKHYQQIGNLLNMRVSKFL